MKTKIVCLLVVLMSLVSCESETPGSYEYDGSIVGSDVMDHINKSLNIVDEKQQNYVEIGSLITNSVSGLENTTWVLTKMRRGGVFLTPHNETIKFVDKLNYILYSGTNVYYGKYSLYRTTIGLTLTLKSFAPFGGGTYSANIYEVNNGTGTTIVINEAKFTNDYDSNDLNIIATFEQQL